MPELPITWGEGWLWLGGSLLLAVLWANLAWSFRRPRSGAVGEFVGRLAAWPLSPWLLQILRLIYYVGLPSAAFFLGKDALIEKYLGLSGGVMATASVTEQWADWAHDLGWAAALGIGAWGLLALGWLAYRRAVATASERTSVSGAQMSAWEILREAAFHELHWAFYRNVPITATFEHAGNTVYWGIWIGLALAALEAALNPALRQDLGDPRKAPALLTRGALAIVSSVLFWQTQNLWLALAIHWGVSWGWGVLVRALPLPASSQLDETQA